jgi:hypothetical protein
MNELATAKAEQLRLIALIDEIARGRKVWQTEYLRILAFSGNADSTVKNFRVAVKLVLQLLDMQPIQNKQIIESVEALEAAMALADRFEFNSTKPLWLTTPAKTEAAFDFWYETTYGEGPDHLKPEIKKLFDAYQVGVGAATSEVHRNVRREWAEGKIIPTEKL